MAFIPSRRKKHETGPPKVSLNLTSMMDMFTIILVFLIKTYSTEGQLIHPSNTLTLPSSSVENPPEVALDVVISQKSIMVNERFVESMDNVFEHEQLYIPKLGEALLSYATEAKRIEEQYGIRFSGKVTIQGDKNLPFSALVKVMATCGQSEYPNMRLVVYREKS